GARGGRGRWSPSRPGRASARTCVPWSSRARTTDEPMNPDAPVTSAGPRSADETGIAGDLPLGEVENERGAHGDASPDAADSALGAECASVERGQADVGGGRAAPGWGRSRRGPGPVKTAPPPPPA